MAMQETISMTINQQSDPLLRLTASWETPYGMVKLTISKGSPGLHSAWTDQSTFFLTKKMLKNLAQACISRKVRMITKPHLHSDQADRRQKHTHGISRHIQRLDIHVEGLHTI